MNIDKSGLKNRYTFSFVLVSVIPVLVVMLFFYLPTMKLFENAAVKNNSVKSRIIRNIVDIRAQELHNLSVQISIDNRIKTLLYKTAPLDSEDIFNLNEASKLMSGYKAGNNFISYIAIYLLESDSILTYEGKYDADFFFNSISKFDNMSMEETKDLMAKTYYNEFLPSRQISVGNNLNGKYITYVQSIPVGVKKASANVIMYINQKDMLSLMGVNENEQKDQILILSKGEEIFSTNNFTDEMKDILKLNMVSESGSFIYKGNGNNNILVSYNKSDLNDWSYIVLSNTNDIVASVGKIRDLAVIIALLSFVIGILLSVFMAKFSYKPWTNLIKYLGAFNNKKNTNEYLLAISIIENIRNENDRLLNDMDKSKNYVKKYILQNLCSGKNNNEDIIAKNLGVFQHKSFFVVVIDSNKNEQLRHNVILAMAKYVSIYFGSNIYEVDDEKGRICLVINTSLVGNYSISNKIRELRTIFENHYGIEMHIGAGQIYDDINRLHESYKEARKSLDYCLLKGKDYVVYYPEIEKYIFTSMNLPGNADNPLLNALKAGDFKSCSKLLDEYFGNLTNAGNFSMQYMYCLFYNFVTVIIKACEETHADFSTIFGRNLEQILDIEQFRSSKQLLDSVYSLYMTMCEYVQKKKVPNGNFLKKQIENMLNISYSKKCISLVEIADNLGYSSSYLSRYINQEFGIGFGDLLNRIRLDNAKKLIISEQQLCISKVAEMTGYSSVNSFTRTFKRAEGVTPGKYREMNCLEQKTIV